MLTLRRSLPIALIALLAAGCTCDGRLEIDAKAVTSATASPTHSAAPVRSALEPLVAESWRIDLPVGDFGAASVSVPLGAREPRPVLIALHGNFDRPDWQCGTWRGITDGYPFVICPRGVLRTDSPKDSERYTYASADRTEQELKAALRSLKQRFGAYVASGSVVLAGFSLGAAHSLSILRQEPKFFSRIVLIEGGHAEWSAGLAAVFAKGGGRKALFVCAQTACKDRAQRSVTFTERAGAEARLVYPGHLGHVFDGRVAKAIKEQFAWLVEDDPNWARRAGSIK